MKFMVVLSAFVAVASAQVPYPGIAPGGPYATAYSRGYAPAFGYSHFGAPLNAPLSAPAVTTNSALNVFNPYFYNFHPYQNLYAAAPFAVAAPALSPAVSVATPAAAVAAPAEAAVVLKAIDASAEPVEVAVEVADEDVTVVEADAAPIIPVGPVHLRPIFPIFGSDLRDASENIVFARPDQINPVKPLVIKENADELPAVLSPDFNRRLFPAVASSPSGIVQATQPRFFFPPSSLSNPVLAF